jgi:hypothetical protein
MQASISARELALHLEPHAVIAAVLLHRVAEVVEHLREGERDHDEVDAARAHRDGADHQRHQRRGEDGHGPLQPAAVIAVEGENAYRVAADAEVGGVAEGHQPAVAEDQIEAGGRDGEDHHTAQKVDVIRLPEQHRQLRHR